MIKKLKIGFLVAVLSLSVVASSANAANITYSADSRILLTGNLYTITIKSGSVLTSLVVNTTSIDVVVPISSTFTIESRNNTDLSGAGGATSTTNTCTGTTNSRVITTGAGSTGTYTITPNGGVCAGSSGGGGGAAPADTTPPTATSVSINAGATTSAVLASNLTLAATDATQMLISNDSGFVGASWETYATSKSWTLVSGDGVKTVYVKFRDAALNMSMAVSDTITVSGSNTVVPPVAPPLPPVVNKIPGCGNKTTGFSSSVVGLSCVGNTSTSTSTTMTAPGTTGPYNFGTAIIKNGSKGEAVKELQRFLNQVLNLGLIVDGKLGPKTILVIKKWQKDNGLVADGLIGAKTKVKMNASVR